MNKGIHFPLPFFPLLMTKSPVEVNILDIFTIKITKVLLLASILAFDATLQYEYTKFYNSNLCTCRTVK